MTTKQLEALAKAQDADANQAARKRGAKRTADVRARVKDAISEIEKEMAANEGIYPHGKGALSAAEVARRAGIHPTSFFTEKLKDLGDEVRRWLLDLKKEKIVGSVKVGRALAERLRDWRQQYEGLLQSHRDTELDLQETQFQLTEARERIEALERQVARLQDAAGSIPTERIVPFRAKGGT
jgi:triphosphoribosyl-dephospho-CoA synthetase